MWLWLGLFDIGGGGSATGVWDVDALAVLRVQGYAVATTFSFAGASSFPGQGRLIVSSNADVTFAPSSLTLGSAASSPLDSACSAYVDDNFGFGTAAGCAGLVVHCLVRVRGSRFVPVLLAGCGCAA